MAHCGRQPADDALAALLATGATVRDAAEQAGLSERTAHRRQADPDFRRRVSELRGLMVGQTTGRLADAALAAAGELRRLMEGGQAEAVRLRAAVALLDLAHRYREGAELEERLQRLEELAKDKQP